MFSYCCIPNRYDKLVNELDQMVEGGYHHRDVVLSSTATPRGGNEMIMIDENMEQQDDDDNNNNEDESVSAKNRKKKGKGKKSRQSAAVKGGQQQPSPRSTSVQTAMKKHRLNSLNETLIEESTFEDDEEDDRESVAAASRKTSQVAVPFPSTPSSSAMPTPTTAAAVNAAVAAVTGGGVPVRRLSQQMMTTAPPVFFPPTPQESVTTSSAAPSRNASFSRAITKISFFGSLGAIAQAQKTVQNQFQSSTQNNQLLPNSGSTEGLLLPEHGSADLSEGGNSQPGKFFVRKLEEDANLTEKIMSNAAIRMKDSLVQQISDLENKLLQEKQQKEKEYESYLIKEKGHQLRDCILSSEITRLNKEVRLFVVLLVFSF
jgi:hypothetical protein